MHFLICVKTLNDIHFEIEGVNVFKKYSKGFYKKMNIKNWE